MKNISIKEIASLSNVSTATVSRILNNKKGRFSEETRKQVMSIIKKYNYKRNSVAKSLRTNKTNSIGVIIPDITNEFFARLVLSIEMNFFEYGYSLLVCNTNEEEKKEKMHVEILESKGVDGFIYISGGKDSLLDITRNSKPVICIDRKPQIKKHIMVIESDNYNGGFIAAEYMIKSGCKKIVMIRDCRNLSTANNRFRGYKDALKKYGIHPESNLVAEIPVDIDEAKNVILKLLDNNIVFDGIFAHNDSIAIGALNALKDRGIKVPDMVKIVGFDDISLAKYSYPSITTISQDYNKIGALAVEMLLKMINGESIIEKNWVVPVKLIVRGSC